MEAIGAHSTEARCRLRPAADGDADAIAALYAHYVEHTAITFDLEAPGVDAWRERRRRAGETGHPWWVAEGRDGLAGYATTQAFSPKPAYRTTVESTIYLAGGYDGRGLGGALYGTLLGAARDAGFRVALALITVPNPASVRLHERLGFVAAGRWPQVGFKLGAWRDVGVWHLHLDGLRADHARFPGAG